MLDIFVFDCLTVNQSQKDQSPAKFCFTKYKLGDLIVLTLVLCYFIVTFVIIIAVMAQTRSQTRNAEYEELKASVETWRIKVEELEKKLADTEKELSNAGKMRIRRAVTHTETLAELSSTEAALEESQLKCVALEETFEKTLEEKDESHQRELQEKEESMKKMIQEEHERELDIRFDGELQKKEENMKQELLLLEQTLINERNERERIYEEKFLEKEQSMRKKLVGTDGMMTQHLNELFQVFLQSSVEMCQRQNELENQLQETMRRREEEDEQINQELQRLSEELCQIQVRRFNHCSSGRKCLMIFSLNLKHNFSFL